MKVKNLVYLSLVMLFAWSCQTTEEVQNDIAPEVSSDDFTISDKTIKFNSWEGVATLQSELSSMSFEEYTDWTTSNSIETPYLVFNNIMEEESEISDYYESLSNDPNNEIEIPKEEVRAADYQYYINLGVITEIKEENGSYTDYNFKETDKTTVLNLNREMIVNDTLYRYSLDKFELIPLADDSQSSSVFYTQEVSSSGRVKLAHAWRFESTHVGHSNSSNGWDKHGSWRYKMWLEGSSSVSGNWYFVTNIFRAQGMKKNFWGNYKFNGTKRFTLSNQSWHFIFNFVAADHTHPLFPLSSEFPAVKTSPLSFDNYVNNLTLKFHPHITGHYSCSCYNVLTDNLDMNSGSFSSFTAVFNGRTYTFTKVI